mgnify:CR=1 FL=1
MAKNLDNLLKSDNLKYLLIIISVVYVLILQHIDRDLLEYVNSLAFRIVYVIIIIYISQLSPSIALILFALFMFTLHELNCKNLQENFSVDSLLNLFRKDDNKKPDLEDVKNVKDLNNTKHTDAKDTHKVTDAKDANKVKDSKDANKVKHKKEKDKLVLLSDNVSIESDTSKPVKITLDDKPMFNTIVPTDDSCIPVSDPKSIEDVKGFCPDIKY